MGAGHAPPFRHGRSKWRFLLYGPGGADPVNKTAMPAKGNWQRRGAAQRRERRFGPRAIGGNSKEGELRKVGMEAVVPLRDQAA
jgi:hypothetical protein